MKRLLQAVAKVAAWTLLVTAIMWTASFSSLGYWVIGGLIVGVLATLVVNVQMLGTEGYPSTRKDTSAVGAVG